MFLDKLHVSLCLNRFPLYALLQRNLQKGLHHLAKKEHYCNKVTVFLLSCVMV